MQAHEVFVAMKKDMLKIKDSLEQRVKSHKELVRKARSIEQDIEVTLTLISIHYHTAYYRWYRENLTRQENYGEHYQSIRSTGTRCQHKLRITFQLLQLMRY